MFGKASVMWVTVLHPRAILRIMGIHGLPSERREPALEEFEVEHVGLTTSYLILHQLASDKLQMLLDHIGMDGHVEAFEMVCN